MEDKTFELLTKMYIEITGKIDVLHNELIELFLSSLSKL